MSGERDIEGAVVKVLATATAAGFYGAMIFGVYVIATGS
jgi:hypothetical protein